MPVVFYPLEPYPDLSDVVASTVMIISASIVIYRIYNKSKNTFAYALMGLTLTIGVSNFGDAFCDAFRNEVKLADRVHHFESEYTKDTFNFLYYISTGLQGWIFAMRYLQSAVECSLIQTCLTSSCIKYTGLGVGFGYTIVTFALILSIMITFPSWPETGGSMDQYYDWEYGLATNIYLGITSIWSTLSIVSTITTIYAIRKIFAINRELSLTNPNVNINRNTMVLHSTLLIV